MSKFKVHQKGAVTQFESTKPFNLFITSDVHFDSMSCNRQQFFADLDYAMGIDAMIFIVGDFFDAMNGRFDPRRDMAKVRPEYRREEYYDSLVDDASRKLAKYSSNIAMISDGNHELSVLKNANTDITGRLVKALSKSKHKIHRGGYGGIVLMKHNDYVTPIKYFHGSGGEAPVSRGAIQTNRQAVFLPDFTVILNGHSHHAYWIPIVRERVDHGGKQYFDIQHHVRTPGYNMAYGDGTSGWEVTRGMVPKPVGSSLISIIDMDILVTPLIHAPEPIAPIIDIYDGIEFPQE